MGPFFIAQLFQPSGKNRRLRAFQPLMMLVNCKLSIYLICFFCLDLASVNFFFLLDLYVNCPPQILVPNETLRRQTSDNHLKFAQGGWKNTYIPQMVVKYGFLYHGRIRTKSP